MHYFRPSLSYHLSLRLLFCLFLSGPLRQALHVFLSKTIRFWYISHFQTIKAQASLHNFCRLNRAFAAHIHKVAEHRDSVGRALDWGSKVASLRLEGHRALSETF